MSQSSSIAVVRQRMEKDRTAWMATTRPDGRPHVAPIWFVWLDDRVYVMTGGVKLDNAQRNGLAALNTEDGVDVAIVEGTARIISPNDDLFSAVAKVFIERYQWDIADSIDHNQLIEITPVKTLKWKA
jgi:nitroimidazol reductase NimA-like FMN-containing flavoprotein (pyridoxamine 5'-phosphate oxidase superfamily)